MRSSAITQNALESVAGTVSSVREAADKLGIDRHYLSRILNRRGLRHLFPDGKKRLKMGEKVLITRADVEHAAELGYILPDAADHLGVSIATLRRMKERWGIEFPNQGKAAYIAKVGYVG